MDTSVVLPGFERNKQAGLENKSPKEATTMGHYEHFKSKLSSQACDTL